RLHADVSEGHVLCQTPGFGGSLAPAALRHRPVGPREVERRVDEPDVRKRLREVFEEPLLVVLDPLGHQRFSISRASSGKRRATARLNSSMYRVGSSTVEA